MPYSTLPHYYHIFVTMILAMAFTAQLAEYCTRLVRWWVWFPTERSKLHFLEQVPVGL